MKNLSHTDKLIRVALAFFLIYYTHFSGTEIGGLAWLSILAYAYLLITSLFSFCYIYYPFGLSTYRTKPRID